jgi:hypothetical protein
MWQVGPVTFRPAGAVAGLIEAAQRAASAAMPDWYAQIVGEKAGELGRSAVADVTVTGIEEAIPLVERALAVLRVVQRLENPMVDARHQAFGLPGQVTSARVDFLDLSAGAALGWHHVGAATGWTFSDQDHDAWSGDPAYRFLAEALACPEAARSPCSDGHRTPPMNKFTMITRTYASAAPGRGTRGGRVNARTSASWTKSSAWASFPHSKNPWRLSAAPRPLASSARVCSQPSTSPPTTAATRAPVL